ncbi:MAG: hypothetical protein NTZ01_04505 [Verrucomicrobia bacterium]|nr:hypothetical protein [Verrucomicrobiota bacterium]
MKIRRRRFRSYGNLRPDGWPVVRNNWQGMEVNRYRHEVAVI